ncbi:ParB/RepB/Spo0J family partition protein [Streptomyces sp. WMMC1477]|uniref:ParB/RepB/Spo0J family partition protein n=1 Tax=Streptomyces sp. WMMC1477 TaxID=3015155 RepID=UPI0022B6A726|nr:ParB/RepB/Spo0J family partition protein [Streptomyces sp. WMMC1477]MCZ7430095.1 ParB/RepB/Spo0J family partition protein [Streptomyces sp. WMMC1477]
MSVADKLGAGSSFGRIPRSGQRSERGRAKAIAQGDIPEYELVRLSLAEVSPTPLNPRRNFGSEAELNEFGEKLRKVQLAACTAVTRAVYLKLWPDHEDRIGSAQFVLVNGERRYRAALQVGLESLDFVVRDELADSREEFVDNLLKENLDREDFDVIERARGVQELVAVCHGNQSAAAARLGKDRSWVTNQLALLTLPEEIQALLSAGEMAERDGRQLARRLKENPALGAADLVSLWKDIKAQEAAQREEQKELLRAAREAQMLSADNTTATQEPGHARSSPDTVLSADNTEHLPPAAPTPGATPAVLSADNTDEPTKDNADVLSADNTEAGESSASSAIPHQGSEAADGAGGENSNVPLLRQLLGETAADQAAALAEAFSAEELAALLEALSVHA